MKQYVDKEKLQEFATKLTNKYKNIFATRLMVGTPLTARTPEEISDTSKIYVYVGETTGQIRYGTWRYYDTSLNSWREGGYYNSTGFSTDDTLSIPDAAADAKAVGDAIAALTPTEHSFEFDISDILTDSYNAATIPSIQFFVDESVLTTAEWNSIKDKVIKKVTVDYGGTEKDIINDDLSGIYSGSNEYDKRFLLPIKPSVFEETNYSICSIAFLYDESAIKAAFLNGDFDDATKLKIYWDE